MPGQPVSSLPGLPSRSRIGAALFGAALVPLMMFGVACFGGDDDDEPATGQGTLTLATSTPTASTPAEPTQTPVRVGGTLVPLNTATPAPSATSSGGGTTSQPEPAAMIDLVPCGDHTYFEEQTMGGDVPVLAYQDVPVGTPILFPFEEGFLLEADAREGAIVLFYDVPDVGILSIHAAGSNTLDRNANYVQQGSVIGHFDGTFEAGDTDALEGYQLFAVIGDEAVVEIGDTIFAGRAVDPDVTDCLILP